MKKQFNILVLIWITSFLISGCSVQWTEAIHYGHIFQNDFDETIDLEIQKDLLFVNVTIQGKQYRFLFDSGAPFSISEELQNNYAFKTISQGKIIDSDHNKKKVNWVQVDTLHIGAISFLNQTAFVGDFNANPILECLNIDGIIGSNLMRHCNWTINQERKKLSLSSNIDASTIDESIIIPFKKDFQYNVFLDISIGRATLKNMLLDYGSNGSIAINKEAFSILKEKKIIDQVWIEKGFQQSGLVGEPVEVYHEIAMSDSVKINDFRLKNVLLKTGKTDLIGNKVLSKFIVTIDWNNKNLCFTETAPGKDSDKSYGFRIGYTTEEGIHIRSVIENSPAYKKGIRPNMQVVKINTLDFENGHDFCDYVNLEIEDTIFLEFIDLKGQRQEIHIDKATL
ncbi:aspartyl protease family protein [Mariniphaga sediminis]|uniref:aspartyl protease family protein n=1 Tax=Mariniphaga sediminis TaxID=1628158 RepID=UPI00356408C2